MLQTLTSNTTETKRNSGSSLSSQGFVVASPPEHHTDLPSLDFEVTVITEAAELRNRIDAWQRLAETAIEPNVFYEWWSLLPAFENLVSKKQKVAVIVIEAPLRVHPDDRRILCGLIPVVLRRSLRGLPVSTIEMWQHDYCYLTTPLIRADVARESIGAFLDWMETGKSRLWHLPQMSSSGPFDRLLTELLAERGRLRITRDRHYRAVLVRRGDAEQAMQVGTSRKRRHEVRRLLRRLESIGTVTVEPFDSSCDLHAWINDFLQLESTGWKGREGTSIIQSDAQKDFFETMMTEADRLDRLEMIRMQLDGRTIAIKVNLLADEGAFCFKIAYDEKLARFSPGVLLEIANIEQLHESSQTTWMDSCAVANHPIIETFWPDRRCIESVIVPGAGLGSNLVASTALLLRAFKMSARSFRALNKPAQTA